MTEKEQQIIENIEKALAGGMHSAGPRLRSLTTLTRHESARQQAPAPSTAKKVSLQSAFKPLGKSQLAALNLPPYWAHEMYEGQSNLQDLVK